MNSLNKLVEILRNWPHEIIPDERFAEDCHERLRKTLVKMKEGSNEVGRGDIAGLIGHVLRRERASSGDIIQFCMPKGTNWPETSTWEDYSVKVLQELPTAFIIEARPWTATWFGGDNSILEVFAERQRRKDDSVIADPCITETFGEHFRHYVSSGQCAAVRSVFFSRPGATLVINLPTGAGKSLVAWAPALVKPEGRNFTLVIVPTVALAMDQERQVQQFLKDSRGSYDAYPLAWHSGLGDDVKPILKRRIVDGVQRILFTSPESVSGSLIGPLYEANRRGHLKYFIIRHHGKSETSV
jgi:hypothetical protein